MPPPAPPTPAPALDGAKPVRRSALAWLDAWMARHPWHPRLAPFAVYILILAVIDIVRPYSPLTYPFLYTFQCALVLWMLLRYRRLLPELTVSFHWASVPVGVGVAAVWIVLGWGMSDWYPGWFASEGATYFARMDPPVRNISLTLRLIGMSVVVPLFEELFIRSLLLRSFYSLRRTAIGLFQILQDLPVVGEWLMQTTLGDKASHHPPIFGDEFTGHELGQLSLFGVVASTFVFMIHHALRDWPGCGACALAYCFLLAATRRKGLGPVVWAHGITNALLWVYTIRTGDWQFL